MCHTSPASVLIWAVLMVLLLSFLLFHLWNFDRFKCIRWNSDSGTFKRIMTYSYLLSIPLILAYAIGFAVIKYREGFVTLPGLGVFPKPFFFWDATTKSFIFPLYLCFSIGWSLEMVTHLEELCFWLFLINARSAHQDWFNSLYFRTWAIGSICAIIYMPLITILTRADALRCEAFTFLSGSLGSLSLTIWFLPVLWAFPNFLNKLRKEGVDTATLVRLTKFHELNTIRVVFRFLFVVPLLTLAVDGVRPHPTINLHMQWTDILSFMAAVGCVVSSAITLVIFFPRSIEKEVAARDLSRARQEERRQQVQQRRSLRSNRSGGVYSTQDYSSSSSAAASASAAASVSAAASATSPPASARALPLSPRVRPGSSVTYKSAGTGSVLSESPSTMPLLRPVPALKRPPHQYGHAVGAAAVSESHELGLVEPPEYYHQQQQQQQQLQSQQPHFPPQFQSQSPRQHYAQVAPPLPSSPPATPKTRAKNLSRRWEDDIVEEYESGFAAAAGARHGRERSSVNMLIQNYTSPIDLADSPKYTFTRPIHV